MEQVLGWEDRFFVLLGESEGTAAFPSPTGPADGQPIIGPSPNDRFDPSIGLQYWGDTDTYENVTTGSVFVYDAELDLYVDEEINLFLDVRSPHVTYRDGDTGRNDGFDVDRGRYVADQNIDVDRGRYVADQNIDFDPVTNTYGAEHTVTASLGVGAGNSGVAVLGKADEALYRAKADGRNRVVVSELTAWGPPD